MVSYLMDENGKKTHAVVPIEEWNKIQKEQIKGRKKFSPYPEYHINTILEFIKEHNHLSPSAWQIAYKDFYSYYKKLDMKDIMALQLFRSGILGSAYIKDSAIVYEKLFDVIPIKFLLEKDGTPLKEKSFKIIRDAVSINTELHFLEIFNKTVIFAPDLITNYKTEYQRLRRDAERDRLFIYDLDILYATHMYNTDKDFQNIFTDNDNIIIGDLRSLIYKYIAEHLYNGNISQVYRAAKEGTERIQNIQI